MILSGKTIRPTQEKRGEEIGKNPLAISYKRVIWAALCFQAESKPERYLKLPSVLSGLYRDRS
ncbi:MAG: hypothetical protein Q4D38_04845 [Planctomycetia bacterium]|nr:hypothetical protein [Planctomycetia bacterium]